MPPHEGTVSDSGLRQRKGAASTDGNDADLPAYTWQELAKHNTAASAWVAVEGVVYDVTEWLDRHPGGREMLLLCAGRECTDSFASYHPFTNRPREILHKFKVGTLSTYEFPVYKPDSGFYRTLCDRVGAHFRENNIDPKSPWPGLWRMALVLVVFSLTYAAAFGPWAAATPWAVRLAAAAVMGVCQVLPLLHAMHDSSHTSFGPSQGWWVVVGRFFMDFYAGACMTSWHNQHVVGHHIYTNVIEADPDLPAVLEGDLRRVVPRQASHWRYRFQHIYLPVLYGLLAAKFRVQDFTDTFIAHTNGPVRVNPHETKAWALLAVSKTFFVFYRVLVPLFVFGLGLKEFLALYVVCDLFSGWYLAFNFQVSHVSTECDYPLGKVVGHEIQDEWAVSQVKTSLDYHHGNKFVDFLTGALNYQIVHHLFPSVSQYKYPEIAPIVKQTCEEFDVPYPYLDSFPQAFGAHLKHLKEMGKRGQLAEVHMG